MFYTIQKLFGIAKFKGELILESIYSFIELQVKKMYSAVILPFLILTYFHVLFKLWVNFFRAKSPNNQSLIYRLPKIPFPLFRLCMYCLISLGENFNNYFF